LLRALAPGRQRSDDHGSGQEDRDPLNVLRKINAKFEQWRREEVVQGGRGEDREDD